MNSSNTTNYQATPVSCGNRVEQEVGDINMFSKLRSFSSRKLGNEDKNNNNNNMVQGNANRKSECVVDGTTFDLSNLSSDLDKFNSQEFVKKPAPGLEKKRSERRMMKLYPSDGSVRRKAPSIRNIESFFTVGRCGTNPEDTDHSSFLTDGNESPLQSNRHEVQNGYSGAGMQNDHYSHSARTNDHYAQQQQGHDYRIVRTPGEDEARRMVQGLRKPAPQQGHGYGSQLAHERRKPAPQQNQTHGVLRTPGEDEARRMVRGLRSPSSQHQNPHYDSNLGPGPRRHDRSAPQGHQQQQGGAPPKLTPEEEARRMMEERFSRPDKTPVHQQYTRLAQKPAARPVAAARQPDSQEFENPAEQAPASAARSNLRSSFIRNYSSKLNLKPSAEPSFESFEIEVSPGVYLPMRGAEETEKAVREGRVREMQCFCCETNLCCIDSAEFIYCPECSVIGPIEYPPHNANGVGLGLTEETVDEIVRGLR